MDAATEAAIRRAAREEGVPEEAALAYADRESNGNPYARNSRTIFGMYQMQKKWRDQYGSGESVDPYTQAKGWAKFYKANKAEMAGVLGRDPTDAEAYLGHRFGGVRGANMIGMNPNTPVGAVVTPNELALNPDVAKAGTIGAVTSSHIADMNKRMDKYGTGSDTEPMDFTSQVGAADQGARVRVAGDGPVNTERGALDFTSQVQPKKNLLEQARDQYPVLKKYDYGYTEKFRPGGGYLEHWEPGEAGAPTTPQAPLDGPRPTELPLDKHGLEIRDPNTRPIDVLGDIASHHLVNADPVVKKAYQDFQNSMTPEQHARLQDQYQYAQKNEGETRPYEDWKAASGMPAYFRGYTFQQWPKEFNDDAYTPEQRQSLDGVMGYLKGNGTAPSTTDMATPPTQPAAPAKGTEPLDFTSQVQMQ